MNIPAPPFVPGRTVPRDEPPARAFLIKPPFVHGRVSEEADAELPSIDEFLDLHPPIEDFAPVPSSATEPAVAGDWPSWGGQDRSERDYTAPAPPPASAAWESFDWQSAGRLGTGAVPTDADREWASTDWTDTPRAAHSQQSAAEALAEALDQIARRIRAGELAVAAPGTVKSDSAIAATLAALMGVRR